jgi:hypothetical protein
MTIVFHGSNVGCTASILMTRAPKPGQRAGDGWAGDDVRHVENGDSFQPRFIQRRRRRGWQGD